MNDFITPEIISAFNGELEKIASKAPLGFFRKLLRSATKRSVTGGGSSRIYSTGRGKFMNRKGGFLSGSELKSGKFNVPGESVETVKSGPGKEGIIKRFARGVAGAGVLSGLAVIGGAAGSPSPNAYRYR